MKGGQYLFNYDTAEESTPNFLSDDFVIFFSIGIFLSNTKLLKSDLRDFDHRFHLESFFIFLFSFF